MQSALQITARDMPHSEALDARIREAFTKLEKKFPRLTSCHIVMDAPHHHQQHRKLFAVRLNITFPGGEVMVNRDNYEDVYILLHDAFNAAWHGLEKSALRRDDGAKAHHGLPPETPVAILETNNE